MTQVTADAGQAPAPSAPHRHGFWTKFFYGVGSVAFGVKDNGFSTFLLIYYNQVLGLSAARAGLALMLALVIDSVIDPVVGYLSDNLRSRWGRRHPFMYAAAIPTSLAYYFLWLPPAGLSQDGLFLYLIVMAIFVRSLITCYEIPSSAMVAELTQDYDQRTSYLSLRFFFGWCGGLTMALLAYTVFLKSTAAYPVGQLNPEGYRRYAVAASAIMFSAIMISALGTHSAIPYMRAPPPPRRLSFGARLKEVVEAINSRSALALLGSGMLIAATAGVIFSMSTYISTYFWLLQPKQLGVLTLASFIAAAVFLTVAPRLSRRFGKKNTAIGATLLAIAIIPLLLMLRLAGVLPDARTPGVVPLIFVSLICTTSLGTIGAIMVASMIADVVEQNELRLKRRTEGVLFAANAFIQKCVTGLGIFATSLILGFAGFPAKAAPGSVPWSVLTKLVLAYSAVVAVLYLLSAACLLLYRITRESHEANLKALETAAAELPTEATPYAGRTN